MPVVQAKAYVEYRNEGYWVVGTRISLDSIVYAFRNGLPPESIVQSFPLLTLEQVYGAIPYGIASLHAFYLANRAEIDAYLTAEEAEFDAMPQPLQATDPSLYSKLILANPDKQGSQA